MFNDLREYIANVEEIAAAFHTVKKEVKCRIMTLGFPDRLEKEGELILDKEGA